MILQRIIAGYGLILCWLVTGCSTLPPATDTTTPSALSPTPIERALAPFRALDAMAPYFNDAYAIVILPHNFRAGTGFGAAVGKGWVVQNGQPTATVWHWQFMAGADLGFQLYQQILFLKDADALAFFMNEPFQFAGQANATAGLWGKSWTPSYNQGVALFTLIDGGLLLEGSVGLHSYHTFPKAHAP